MSKMEKLTGREKRATITAMTSEEKVNMIVLVKQHIENKKTLEAAQEAVNKSRIKVIDEITRLRLDEIDRLMYRNIIHVL